jgi:hypothetical protein
MQLPEGEAAPGGGVNGGAGGGSGRAKRGGREGEAAERVPLRANAAYPMGNSAENRRQSPFSHLPQPPLTIMHIWAQ